MSLEYKGLEGLLYLGKDAENYNQLVYASQLYGTFFAVYASFRIKETSNSQEVHVAKAEFTLKNYKGKMDIGLKSAKYDSKSQQILLQLQALGKNKKRVLTDFTIDPSVNLFFVRDLIKINEKKYPGVHDDEFLYRDGDFLMKRPPYDLINDLNRGAIESCIENSIPSHTDISFYKAPGGRCMMSEFNVLT